MLMYMGRLVGEKAMLCSNLGEKNEFRLLLEFATIETHFLIKGTFYDQVDATAMGSSPLAPILANLFMGHCENSCMARKVQVN